MCPHKVQTVSDFERLLGDPNLDAFVIATPNFHHIDVLRSALETGKPILCEKPLCTTLDDTREILSRITAGKQIFQVGMEYRFKPALADMIARVDAGEIGRLHMLSIREHRFPFLQKVDDWNRFNRNTGGTLVEKCCHFFDLMRRIIGSEPVRVMASAERDVNHLDENYNGDVPDILDNAYVIFDFENGARARLICACSPKPHAIMKNYAQLAKPEKSSVCCRKISWRAAHAPIGKCKATPCMSRRKFLMQVIIRVPHIFKTLAFLRAVRGEADVIVTAEDGHRAVAMGAAAQMAAAEARIVSMKEVGL